MTHLEFMGVPLKGSSKEFFSVLKETARIYSVEKETESEVKCTLNFTKRIAHVTILGDPVYSVGVSLEDYSVLLAPTEKEWEDMVNDFNEYKEALTLKYGYPSSVETKLERKIHRSPFDAPDYIPKWIDENDGLSCSAKYKVNGGCINMFTTIGGGMIWNKTALIICYTDEYNKNNPNPKPKPLDKKFNDL